MYITFVDSGDWSENNALQLFYDSFEVIEGKEIIDREGIEEMIKGN